MPSVPDDICPRHTEVPVQPTSPFSPPIYLASVWSAESTDEADSILAGRVSGYMYQRDGHPNADLFAAKCCELHRAQRAAVTSSGMAALVTAVLSQIESGDHVVVSKMLFGRSLMLLGQELTRLGISSTLVDTGDLAATAAAFEPRTKLLAVETISNPLLRVANIPRLAELAHSRGAKLLVDNTFATPVLCQPLTLGADLVFESVSKMMNGHSDVMLGLLCGGESVWERVPLVVSCWGLASSPFDCWLSLRGLSTLHLRVERACVNAMRAAEFLATQAAVEHVDYPGLANHCDHELATKLLGSRYGSMVTIRLPGGRKAADAFMHAAKRIAFCPSFGEVATTLSHPETTSHRSLTPQERAALGIHGGTIRLSVGVESAEYVIDALAEGLASV